VARSRVELFEAIRRDERRDGLSIRALADRHGVHRRTVRQALGNAVTISIGQHFILEGRPAGRCLAEVFETGLSLTPRHYCSGLAAEPCRSSRPRSVNRSFVRLLRRRATRRGFRSGPGSATLSIGT